MSLKPNRVLDGIFGLCVGDALGLPVQGISRKEIKENTVTGMIGYGVFNQPPGTWSDDSSLTFCLAESLCNGYNLEDIADKFCKWLYEGYWTPFEFAFDIGITTNNAINRLKIGVNPHNSGDTDEYCNGNGSLMRILPLSFYLENFDQEERFKIIHEVSSITHAHPRSLIACSIYIHVAINLLKGDNKIKAYENMKGIILDFYRKAPYKDELRHFKRILNNKITDFDENEIKSGGYVLDTLEASLWSFLKTDSYRDALLTVVNLGGDTDTTGAVTGGLAGIYYGFNDIPEEWVESIAKKDKITELANRLTLKIY